jgi:hypothetical protein
MFGVQIHTAEPLVPESSTFEFQMVIEKIKRRNSPSIDQMPAEFLTAGGRRICLYTKIFLICLG